MIVCRSAAEISKMRAANQFVADVLAELEAAVAPGVTTAELDRLAEKLVRDGGAVPAFKGYRGFPATLCASINDEVVHGIPSAKRELKDGDIISLDVGAKLGGFFGDSAVTVPVGKVPESTLKLLTVTREALDRAIEQVQVGGRLSDIGHAVQTWVEAAGFSIVREFVGHGIGEKLHEEPQIPNYGVPGRGPKLAAGMVLAIEPMVAMGRPDTKVLVDGWTAVTKDGAERRRGCGEVKGRSVAGTVLEVLPRALYRVAIEGGREVVAHAGSGTGRNFVRLLVGDVVTVELSPRDLSRGRIVKKA